MVPKLWYAVHEGLQGGTRDPSVLLYKMKTFCFSLSCYVYKFLRFCVLPLIVSKNGIISRNHFIHAACVSSPVCQTFE